jgi:nucleotide-binding universal stress UspA family protein
MRRTKPFDILFASDDSPAARAAVRTGLRFPWPTGSRGYGVVAKQVDRAKRTSVLLTALDQTSERVAGRLSNTLTRRWPAAPVSVVAARPVEAVLAEAERVHADVIVMGWRGHGPVRRLLAGSVSRGVTRRAKCPVLVVRQAKTAIQRVVLGFDGSALSRRAVELVASLDPPAGGHVTLLTAVERLQPPLQGLMPSTAAEVAAEVRRLNEARVARSREELEQAARKLVARKWEVTPVTTTGVPLEDVLAAVVKEHADLLVVGARGASSIEHLLLGSVAEGALNRCPVPVLIVR